MAGAKDYKPTNKTSDELMFGDDSSSNTDGSNQTDTTQQQDETDQNASTSQTINQDSNQSDIQDSSDQLSVNFVENGEPRITIPNSYNLFELIPVLKSVIDSYYEEYASYIQVGDNYSPLLMAKGLDVESTELCIQLEGAFNLNSGEKNPFYNDVHASLSSLRQTINMIKESYVQNNLHGILDQMGSFTEARNQANAANDMINVSSK